MTAGMETMLREDLARVSSELADIARRQAEMAASGDLAAMADLARRAAKLTESQSRLLARIGRVSADGEGSPLRRAVARPQREYIIDALNVVGEILTTKATSSVVQVLFDVAVSETSYPSLRDRERSAFDTRPNRNPVWIVPALSADSLSPLPRFLALSTWPAERRVMGTRTARVAQLKLCLLLTQRLFAAPDRTTPVAQLLHRLVMDYASTVPGAIDASRRISQRRIEQACRGELEQVVPLDDEERGRAAARLVRFERNPRAYLWGILDHFDGGRAAR